MPSKPRKSTQPRNHNLTSVGVPAFSRSKMYTRSGRFAIKNKKAVATKAAEKPTTKVVEFGKKKEKRTVSLVSEPGFYPTVDTKPAVRANKPKPRPFHVRKSITPGAVLILLAGRFRGRRVVCLKVLESGLLLVSGPYKVNGVPLKRVNQAYVIATSTHVDVSSVKVPEHVNDAYFAKDKKPKEKKSEADFLAKKDKKEKKPLPDNRKADQKTVDSQLLPIVNKTASLKAYLSARFSLSKNVFAHELKF